LIECSSSAQSHAAQVFSLMVSSTAVVVPDMG
jgi:hypothetical protein